MGCTVFADGSGLFHKGSGGTGMAFPDVCLSPPPAPTGPIPIPYPNNLKAGDLTKGSTSVKIEGNPTALKNQSSVSTSTGDEAGNQGGNVVTHKTAGKGYFSLWSFTVKIEGKNACRHDDPMGQNCASTPAGGLDVASRVVAASAEDPKEKCEEKYSRKDRHGTPTPKQRFVVNTCPPAKGPPILCWECGKPSPKPMIPDHQPPLVVNYYAGGCHDKEKGGKQEKFAKSPKSVKPHCTGCSSKQGGFMSGYSRTLKGLHGLLPGAV